MTYLKEAWYVAGFAEEVTRTPLRRTLLDQSIVLYRTEAGAPVALNDVCPHRRAPLHLGRLHGDDLACPYHGLRFDASGICVYNPNFNKAPPTVKTRNYPTVEQDDMVWIWMGEATSADAAKIPCFRETVASERITAVHGYLNIKASEPLISDNLLDLSHAEFLHPYLANPGFNGRLQQSFQQEGDRVLSLYSMRNEKLTPILGQLWDKPPIEQADMRFNMRWDPPSCLLLEIGATRVGESAQAGITAWVSHLLTPETETSTHYFWTFARDSRLQDAEFSSHLRDGITQAFIAEDAPIIEWQQRYTALPGAPPIARRLLDGDTGGVRARLVTDKLRNAEQRAGAA